MTDILKNIIIKKITELDYLLDVGLYEECLKKEAHKNLENIKKLVEESKDEEV